MSNRTARLMRIQELVATHNIASQSELQMFLSREDFHVTQATLSRDLEILGAIKVPTGNSGTHVGTGGTHYAIPDDGTGDLVVRDDSRLARVVEELAASFEYSGNIVVIRTPPGAASYLASAIDRSGMDSIIGTVAGDDTVMLVTRDPAGGSSVATQLKNLARSRARA